MQNELNTLRATVLLGQDCEAFFNTDPGRYVKAIATETVMEAMEEIKHVDPSDMAKIQAIQLKIKSADNALIWLNEAIRNGRLAYQQLEIMSEQEGQQ